MVSTFVAGYDYQTEIGIGISKISHLYALNEDGEYEWRNYTSDQGEFLGDKIYIIDEEPVVVNTKHGLGVSTQESVKILNVTPGHANDRGYRKLLSFKHGYVKYLKRVPRGTRNNE